MCWLTESPLWRGAVCDALAPLSTLNIALALATRSDPHLHLHPNPGPVEYSCCICHHQGIWSLTLRGLLCTSQNTPLARHQVKPRM